MSGGIPTPLDDQIESRIRDASSRGLSAVAPLATRSVAMAPSPRRTSDRSLSRMSFFMDPRSPEDEGACSASGDRSTSTSSFSERIVSFGVGIGTCRRGHTTSTGCRGIKGPVPPPLWMKPAQRTAGTVGPTRNGRQGGAVAGIA